MKLVRWTQFTWDLTKLPAVEISLESNFAIRQATHEEHKVVHKTICSAFALDMDWSDTLKLLQGRLDAGIERIFQHKQQIDCLVITHGARVIGASALDTNPEAEINLLSGPAILSEYRNRGLGSKLLYRSLEALKITGLSQARGVIKSNVLAAKYVYPKFNPVSVPCDFSPRTEEQE
jgi:N-acetylglutamate synthase-like GNAT family acetyltransferase